MLSTIFRLVLFNTIPRRRALVLEPLSVGRATTSPQQTKYISVRVRRYEENVVARAVWLTGQMVAFRTVTVDSVSSASCPFSIAPISKTQTQTAPRDQSAYGTMEGSFGARRV